MRDPCSCVAVQFQIALQHVSSQMLHMVIEVHRGMGRTGVLRVLRASKGTRSGLHAGIDALSMQKPHASPTTRRLEAKCMLAGRTGNFAGAAWHLVRRRDFDARS